jgi:predicted dehydrogenase
LADAALAMGAARFEADWRTLVAAEDVQCVYVATPVHLHASQTVAAAEAGKHVLCEKPISLTTAEARHLISVRDRTGVKIGEAFMVHTHPQWLRAREIVRSGEIGDLRSLQSFFSYNNRDPKNIRNIPEYGGGALMDVGCYPITISRFLFEKEPLRAVGLVERDPEMGIDRLTSAILDFPGGQSVFTCSTQVVPYQKVQILGTKGRIELEVPFNAPPDQPARLYVDNGADLYGGGRRHEEFPLVDQYTTQGDAFSRAILQGGEVPTTLENALGNMAAIEAVFRSAQSGTWEKPY